MRRRQRVRVDVVAAPATPVRRQLRKARQLRHQRTDESAVARDDALDRCLARLDALHHLQVLGLELLGDVCPVRLRGDEVRRLSRVAVRGLYDQIGPEARRHGEAEELRVGHRRPHRVRNAGHARLVRELGRHDLRVEPMTQRCGWERDIEAQLFGQLLGLAVEHEKDRLAAGAPVADEVAHLLVAEQVVADLLDRLEASRRPHPRHEHVRMRAVEAVVVVQVAEARHPAVDAEQVERRRRDEVDGRSTGSEVPADVGHARETLAGGHAQPSPTVAGAASAASPWSRMARRYATATASNRR